MARKRPASSKWPLLHPGPIEARDIQTNACTRISEVRCRASHNPLLCTACLDSFFATLINIGSIKIIKY